MNNKYNLDDRLIDFSVSAIKVVQSLPNDKICSHLSSQLLRSSTSSALNYGEALSGESKRDFLHKIKVVLKELRETLTCLKILVRAAYLEASNPICKECDELVAIFVKSVMTAEKNLDR